YLWAMTRWMVSCFLVVAVLVPDVCGAQESPPDGRVYLQWVDSLMRAGQIDSAITHYRALADGPKTEPTLKAGALIGLGQGFLFKGRADTALSFFLTAVEILGSPPQDNALLAEAYAGIGIVHVQAKQWSLAETHLHRALALSTR